MNLLLHRYPHMLHEYYVARIRAWHEARRKRRAEVKTRAQALALQREVRDAVRASFGPFPEKTPLNARVTGRIDRPTYRVEKVLYESRPDFLVSGDLYVPKRLEGKAPCVLVLCGHSGDGKALGAYQTICHSLAMKGFLALMIDPISQGERVQYPDKKGRCKLGLCSEHNMIGVQQMLAGEFFGAWRAWDAVRGLDYLLSRPEADPTRVGVTGNSGGGTMSTWMCGLDERLTMAGPSCFVTPFLANIENENAADAEQIPPGIIAAGVDQTEFLIPMAPKPLVILAQRNDFFDYRGTVEAYHDLRRIWKLLGAEHNLQLYAGSGTHGYYQEVREAMYAFFGQHSGLKGTAKEPRVETLPERETWATKKGSVNREGSRLVFDFTREKAQALAKKRGRVAPERLRRLVAEALVLPKRDGPPHHRILATMRVHRLRFQTFALETEPGIQTLVAAVDPPGWHVPPPRGKRCNVFVPHESANADLVMPKVKRLTGSNAMTFGVDARGVGQSLPVLNETVEVSGPFAADYHHWSHGSLMGEPLLGRRVHDLLSTLDWVESLGYEEIHLIGRGRGAIIALLAAVLDGRAKKVTLLNGLGSWHELTQAPIYQWPTSSLLENVLAKFDLPDCVRALRSRVRVVEPWDAMMKPAGSGRSDIPV